jgi:hypothetical protein
VKAVAAIALSVAFMYRCAYAFPMQRTLGLLLARETGEGDRARVQVAIILGKQLAGINLVFLLGMALYLVIARASAWNYGVLMVVLCVVGGSLIRSILNLQPASPRILRAIASDLERRRESYRSAGDSLRLQAVEELLARLRSFPEYKYCLR